MGGACRPVDPVLDSVGPGILGAGNEGGGEMKHPDCYVCDGPIKPDSNPVYISAGVARHPKCAPGSARYMKQPKWRKLHVAVMAGRKGLGVEAAERGAQ